MIGDGGAAGRGDDSDAPREARQGPLARGGEQALGGQLLLELLEGQLQRAEALRFERFHHKLVFAARFVDVDAAARQHRQPVARLELPVAVRGAEGHAAQLRVAILEGEIVVAAGGQFDPGDLAGNPDIPELRVERRADGSRELADGINPPPRLQLEFERELLHPCIVRWGRP